MAAENGWNMTWRRSSCCYSGACVEVTVSDARLGIRDNARPDDILVLSPEQWSALLLNIKAMGNDST